MKIETFKVSVACKDDVRREDLAASIYGLLNRNFIDTTYAYAAEVDGSAERKAPDVPETVAAAAKPADPQKKRRGRRTKAEILTATAGRGEPTSVERRGQIPAAANAPACDVPMPLA